MVKLIPYIFGLTAVLNLFLGFIAFISNPKNIINISLLFFVLSSTFLGLFNYLYNLPNIGNWALYFLRIHMFFAVWYIFLVFHFSYLDFANKTSFSKKYKFIFLITIFLSILTFSSCIFEKITKISVEGRIQDVKTNWGIIFFGGWLAFLTIASLINFIKKIINSLSKEEKFKNYLIGFGFLISLILNIIFSFIFPNFFDNSKYTILQNLWSLPFIFALFYSIVRFRFLNIRILITEFFVLVLIVLTALQILRSADFIETIIRILILILILIFSFVLLKTARKELEQREKLEELNKKLEELNRLKSEFLSFASHQLKAPMAVIKGYADLIENNLDGVSKEAKDFAKKIKDSVDNLLVLIEEFMDYRKIEEGKMNLNFEKANIIDLIKQVVSSLEFLAKEKKLELIFETEIDSLEMNLDKLRFYQVIQNLVDNAIKYTTNGFVKVKAYKENDYLLICVSDSGIGMSKNLQEKLFGQFVREESIKKEIKGTGLGLYIAKYIVEAHNGKIWAESDGEGKGSRFYIKLPINL